MKRAPYAQGDVLLVPVERVPGTAVEVEVDGTVTLALGEATGHHHSFHDVYDGRVRLFRENGVGDGLYVMVGDRGRAVLEHQEHRPIPVRPGAYRVRKQRTAHSGVVRRVVD